MEQCGSGPEKGQVAGTRSG